MIALLCGPALLLAAGAAQPPPDDWDALLGELEEFEAIGAWADTELEGLGLLAEPAPAFIFSASLAAGGGHSGNFLKRPVAVSSDFWRLAADATLIWFRPNSTLTGAVVYDFTSYARSLEVSSETLFLAQGAWRLERAAWGAGIEALLLYSDQIYDASLTAVSAPVGDRIRQLQPQATVYADWLAGRASQARIDATVRRAEFNESVENHWQAGAGTQWRRIWRAGLNTTARLEAYHQRYDTKPARIGATFAEVMPRRRAEVRGIRLENRLDWSPPGWRWASLQLAAGAAWEADRHGDYNSLRRAWASAGPRAAFSWGHIRLNGRWLENRYTDRRTGFLDPAPLLQSHRSLRAEVLYKLPWDLALKLQAQWSRLASRLAAETCSERRAEAALEWNY